MCTPRPLPLRMLNAAPPGKTHLFPDPKGQWGCPLFATKHRSSQRHDFNVSCCTLWQREGEMSHRRTGIHLFSLAPKEGESAAEDGAVACIVLATLVHR